MGGQIAHELAWLGREELRLNEPPEPHIEREETCAADAIDLLRRRRP